MTNMAAMVSEEVRQPLVTFLTRPQPVKVSLTGCGRAVLRLTGDQFEPWGGVRGCGASAGPADGERRGPHRGSAVRGDQADGLRVRREGERLPLSSTWPSPGHVTPSPPLPPPRQQSELSTEERSERFGPLQQHRRAVASLEKQIQHRKQQLEEVS